MNKLIIGSKSKSSWSLRAWLPMVKSGIKFEEELILFSQPDYSAKIKKHSPSGLVPALVSDGFFIWDSLAICEYIADIKPQFWPSELNLKSHARSSVCEMHAGFKIMRETLSADFKFLGRTITPNNNLQLEIERVLKLWEEAFQLSKSTGWLYGEFSIADAFYAPVALGRFHAYNIKLPEFAQRYVKFLLKDPDIVSWLEKAKLEA